MNVSKRPKLRAFALATAILILTTPICATEAAERQICLFDFHVLGTGAGLLCDEQGPSQKVVDTSCQAFEPVRYSKTDTEETKRQVREHNAAWDALCGKED